jgi:hypothetical protein
MLANFRQRIDSEFMIPLCNHCQILSLLLCKRSVEMPFGRFRSTIRTNVAIIAMVLACVEMSSLSNDRGKT